MSKTTNRGFYSNVWAGWQTKVMGPQPTEAQLATAHAFGRPGKQSMALAMYLRDTGATGAQVKLVSALFDGKNTTHLNKVFGSGGLCATGHFERDGAAAGYKVNLTAKGADFIKRHAAVVDAVEAKPKAKAKGNVAKISRKRNKAPVVTTETAVEAPAAEMPVQAETQPNAA